MKLREMLNAGIAELESAGVENAAFDARQLLMKAYGKTSAELLLELSRDLCPGSVGGMEPANITACPGDCGARLMFDADIKKRASRVPLQHILRKAEFMGLEFEVGPEVLIPRQDTETLVETILESEKEKGISVLDMCTGSGCIAIALKVLGGYADVSASDIDEKALKKADGNAYLNRAELCFIQSDIYENIPERYDLIVSNPPYIRTDVIPTLAPEVKDHDPMKALDGGEDGLIFYRRIIEGAREHLKPGGRLYFEIGYDQAADVSIVLEKEGFTGIEVIQDITGLDRVVKARI